MAVPLYFVGLGQTFCSGFKAALLTEARPPCLSCQVAQRVELEARLPELLLEMDSDEKVQELLPIFARIHDELVQSKKPSLRLRVLLASWNATFKPDGQQRAGKIALAIIIWRRQRGLQAMMQ